MINVQSVFSIHSITATATLYVPKYVCLEVVVYTKLCSSVQWHGARLQPDRGEEQIIAFTKEKEDNMLLEV